MPFFGGGASVANMVGATSSAAGTAGLVPAPAAGTNTRALFSDASFGEVPLFPTHKNTNSGVYIRAPQSATSTQATITSMASLLRTFLCMYSPADGTIDLLGVRFTASPTSGYDMNLSIWEMGEDGLPSSYITGGNAAIAAGAGNVEYTIVVNGAIKRGFFWSSLTLSSAITGATIAGFNPPFNTWWLGATSTNTAAGSSLYTHIQYTCATSYDQTNHETFVYSTSGIIPQIAFQYA